MNQEPSIKIVVWRKPQFRLPLADGLRSDTLVPGAFVLGYLGALSYGGCQAPLQGCRKCSKSLTMVLEWGGGVAAPRAVGVPPTRPARVKVGGV